MRRKDRPTKQTLKRPNYLRPSRRYKSPSPSQSEQSPCRELGLEGEPGEVGAGVWAQDSSICQNARLGAPLTCLHSDGCCHHQQRSYAASWPTPRTTGVAGEVPETAAPPSCRGAVWDAGGGQRLARGRAAPPIPGPPRPGPARPRLPPRGLLTS